VISDDELRQALRGLRAADETSAPSVRDVLDRPRRVYAFDARRVVALSLAASAMLFCTVTVARVANRPKLVITPDVLDLSRWRPTTDALLESPTLAWYAAPSPSDRVFPNNDLPREQYP
jgi:hypothetical protein